jgi:hypothetical protein
MTLRSLRHWASRGGRFSVICEPRVPTPGVRDHHVPLSTASADLLSAMVAAVDRGRVTGGSMFFRCGSHIEGLDSQIFGSDPTPFAHAGA